MEEVSKKSLAGDAKVTKTILSEYNDTIHVLSIVEATCQKETNTYKIYHYIEKHLEIDLA